MESGMENKLLISEQRNKLLLEQSTDIAFNYDISSRKLYDYTVFGEYGLPEEITNVPEGLLTYANLEGDTYDKIEKLIQKIESGVSSASAIINIGLKQHRSRIYYVTLKTIVRKQQKPVLAVGVCHDITEKQEAMQAYAEERQYWSAILASSDLLIRANVSQDRVESLKTGQKAYLEIADNCTYHEYIKYIADNCIHFEEKEKFQHFFSKEHLIAEYHKKRLENFIEHRRLSEDGKYLWYRTDVNLFQDEATGDIKFIGRLNNIDVQKREKMKLEYSSSIDALTNIYNRKSAGTQIENILDEYPNEVHAFLLMDIDNFKQINDSYGHPYGDKVLRYAADKMKENFRSNDILGRIGGDEFIVFMKNIPSKEVARNSALKLHGIFKKLQNKEVSFSASIGLAFYPEHGKNFEELYTKADTAMYRAKTDGKNGCVEAASTGENYKITEKTDSFSEKIAPFFTEESKIADELDDIIYICDVKSYELYYLNRFGRSQLEVKKGFYNGRKCYEVLHGRKSPCPSCSNDRISHQESFVWQQHNSFLNKYYIIKDKMIHWKMQDAKLSYLVDITDHDKLSRDLKNKLDIGNIILDCVREILDTSSNHKSIQTVVTTLAQYYQCDRAYYVEYESDLINIKEFIEYCRAGAMKREKSECLAADFSGRIWSDHIRQKTPLEVEDVEKLQYTSMEDYLVLKKFGVKSLYAMPFWFDRHPAGFLIIENPDKVEIDSGLLESLTYILENIISNRRLQDSYNYLGNYDTLTGLYNRNAYLDYLKVWSIDHIDAIGIVYANVNGVRELNAKYGYWKGDEQIRKVAEILKTVFLFSEVFRLSGDELVVIVRNIEREDLYKNVELVNQSFRELENLGASVGVAWSANDKTPAKLINQAVERMEINKQKYYYQIYLDKKKYPKGSLKTLLEGIEQDRYCMFLQSKCNLSTGEIVGLEALTRYRTEYDEYIMPKNMIYYLEKEHTIRYLDMYILEEACKFLSKWKDSGYGRLPVAINLSKVTLMEEEVLDEINRIREKYDVPEELLEFEITDSMEELESGILQEIAEKFKQYNFRIAMDNFGVLNNNASLINAMRFHSLKLDSNLIQNLENNKENQIIVKYLIQICKEMDMTVIAEGVETEEQKEMLLELGCEYAQGFLLGKPKHITMPDDL